MPEDLTFEMGKFPAVLPGDLRYARNHLWCRDALQGQFRFGFTSYAVRLMQDVYFLDWCVNAGIGNIETSKAVSDLFAPIGGTFVTLNQEVLKDPSAINLDNYGAGWLFEMASDTGARLSVAEYHEFLAANWEKTQRLLKGQINL